MKFNKNWEYKILIFLCYILGFMFGRLWEIFNPNKIHKYSPTIFEYSLSCFIGLGLLIYLLTRNFEK